MSRVLTIVETGGVGCFAKGRGAAEVVEAVTGRRPVRTRTGWAFQAKQVPDVIAAAEQRGYAVRFVVEGGDRP